MPGAAVLGQPIAHSLSPVLHTAGFRALGLDAWWYERRECDAQQLPAVVAGASEDTVGFSVTMPGKFAALAVADTASARATLVGSANTLVRRDTGWYADNTDTEGVVGALEVIGAGAPPAGAHAVIIGGGGTARPALWALAQLGYRRITMVNRTNKAAEFENLAGALGVQITWTDYSFLQRPLADRDPAIAVAISTVPAPAVAPYATAVATVPLVDVIYNPWPTSLVAAAQAAGVPAVGGHVMLAAQAFTQFQLFTGQQPPRAAMWQALTQALGVANNGEFA